VLLIKPFINAAFISEFLAAASQASFSLIYPASLLPQPPKCWDYRCGPPCPAVKVFFFNFIKLE
jgi:hypothetical protein